ncbi:hypothetical protein GCM10011579_092260 [Streptomyces albiflavescens]|uniref:Uncharacterized protein n=1 Tax=Streptomyces albiflavescens TaxID=1623582 RepID=A0A917YF03_9ACTN|nr:hypothetical protein GCM10011579_092260 [Streptomyces albiflavescens]
MLSLRTMAVVYAPRAYMKDPISITSPSGPNTHAVTASPRPLRIPIPSPHGTPARAEASGSL